MRTRGEGRAYGGGGRGRLIYLSLHCHHQNDSCIMMGSDESHFNVSLIVRDKVTKTVSTNQNMFWRERGPKRNRAAALLLTSLTLYRSAKPALSAYRTACRVLTANLPLYGKGLLSVVRRRQIGCALGFNVLQLKAKTVSGEILGKLRYTVA